MKVCSLPLLVLITFLSNRSRASAAAEVVLAVRMDEPREEKGIGSSFIDRRRLLNLARDLQQGIEPFPASHGDIYRVRAMDVNTQLDEYDAVIAW